MTDVIYMKDMESNYIKKFDAEVVRMGDDFIVLDRTAFYPEGGGQPSDTGEIYWEGGDARVKKVEKKGEIIHRIEGEIPEEGMKIHGKIDWERRYTHMKLHTAQHLFSYTVFDMFGGKTVGNQIYTDYSRVDFHPVSLSNDDLVKIEERINELIAEAHPVEIYEEDLESLEAQLGDGRVNLSLLPKTIDRLRVIDIDGYDICPCAGTHVRNTEEIGGVKITDLKNKGEKRQRIYYGSVSR